LLVAPTPVLWLHPDVFAWSVRPSGFVPNAEDPGIRQHEFLEHVDRLLVGVVNPFTLADAVENLNKAVDQRIARLTSAFSLNDLRRPGGGNMDRYELLTHLGVIKPIMRSELNDIRNAVNHEDALPPAREQCVRLAEFAWYFLRSTDGIVRIRELRMRVDDPASAPVAKATILIVAEPSRGWDCELVGTVPPHMLSADPVPQHIRVSMTEAQRAAALSPVSGFLLNTAGMVDLSGRTVLTPEQKITIASLAFACAKRLV
jgi:hypothetical protein